MFNVSNVFQGLQQFNQELKRSVKIGYTKAFLSATNLLIAAIVVANMIIPVMPRVLLRKRDFSGRHTNIKTGYRNRVGSYFYSFHFLIVAIPTIGL